MKKIVHISLITAFLFVFFINSAHAFTFSRSLTMGLEGQDVLELQKILNSNPLTQIASSGVGSPGNETTFFGEKTLEAVKKFQNLYKKEILTPVGLTQSTGFVGFNTISFLNLKKYINYKEEVVIKPEILTYEQLEQQVIAAAAAVQPELGPNGNTPLFYPNTFATHAGIKKQVYRGYDIVDNFFEVGSGIKIKNLDFFLDSTKLKQKRCRSEYVCEYYIPHQTKAGTYKLKTSDPKNGFHEFKIVSMSVPYPIVYPTKNKIPLIIKVGGTTVIEGKNFSNDMQVFTAFEKYTVDAKNDEFTLEIPNSFQMTGDSFQAGFYVENKEGLRSNVKLATYEK